MNFWMGVVLIGSMVAVSVLLWELFRLRPSGDGLVHCPQCNTTKLRQAEGLATFSTPYECENGHTFRVEVGGP